LLDDIMCNHPGGTAACLSDHLAVHLLVYSRGREGSRLDLSADDES